MKFLREYWRIYAVFPDVGETAEPVQQICGLQRPDDSALRKALGEITGPAIGFGLWEGGEPAAVCVFWMHKHRWRYPEQLISFNV